jgi:hypothetical protein
MPAAPLLRFVEKIKKRGNVNTGLSKILYLAESESFPAIVDSY